MQPGYEKIRATLARRYTRLCAGAAPVEHDVWRYSRRPRAADPAQGWKVHVSATVLSAADVLEACVPVLARTGALFKVCRTLDDLLSLNSGLHYSQIGKFLTVYCRQGSDFVTLAGELDRATRRLRGPCVPFDRRYRPEGIVFYRYGAFVHKPDRPEAPDYILNSRGQRRVDRRAAGAAVPSWINDPFALHTANAEAQRVALHGSYVVFRALSQRGKGGVYEALDLNASPARLAVIKEGRRNGEVFWDGSDGRTRLEHEVRVLRALRRDGVGVPEVYQTFLSEKDRYVAMEHIRGRSFMRGGTRLLKRYAWSAVQDIHDRVAELVGTIHAAGWVWRDCKPDNLIVQRGRFRPLDFEGACRKHETDTLPWGAYGYTPPDILQKPGRAPGTREDDFGRGATSYHLGSGRLPRGSAAQRERVLTRSGCPRAFRRKILALLEG